VEEAEDSKNIIRDNDSSQIFPQPNDIIIKINGESEDPLNKVEKDSKTEEGDIQEEQFDEEKSFVDDEFWTGEAEKINKQMNRIVQ
jgi:hypothetical protein